MRKRWIGGLALAAAFFLGCIAGGGGGNVALGDGTEERGKPAEPEERPFEPGTPPVAPATLDGFEEVELEIEPAAELKFRTPNDLAKVSKTNEGNWLRVTDGTLPIRGAKGSAIRFEPQATSILIDLDGDGKLETPVRQELLTTVALRADGSKGPYTFKLRRDGDDYYFTRACVARGKVDGVTVALLDENLNGTFNDVGADAIRIGANAPAAQYVSTIVNVKNRLYWLKADEAGTKMWLKPYEGPVATVVLASKYEAKSRPLYAVLRWGDIYIDAAAAQKGGAAVAVPAGGEYALFDGHVGPTAYQCAKIRPGNMAPLPVAAGAALAPRWGMPGVIDFDVTKNGNRLTILMSSIRIYGQSGEQYVHFEPKTFTPNVQVVDAATGEELYFGSMGVGC